MLQKLQRAGAGRNVFMLVGRRNRESIKSRIECIIQSGLFDANWYIERNILTVCAGGQQREAISHYLTQGNAAGLAPHPLFDVHWYRRNNKSITESGGADLEHYVNTGMRRGSSPSPLFDPAWYRTQVGHKLPRRQDPFWHFLHHGATAGISPHPLFDSAYYYRQDPQLSVSAINPLTHFVTCGALQGKRPHKWFELQLVSLKLPRRPSRWPEPPCPFYHRRRRSWFQPTPRDRYRQLYAPA